MSAALGAADPATHKLVAVMGGAKAQALLDEVGRDLGPLDLSNPDGRLRLGEALVRRGGVLAAIGRSIKIQAILGGAREVI